MEKARVYPALAFAAMALATTADASDYGCRVLLCLANPAGPTAVSECVPPITQLWRDLSRTPPRPFPTCDEARPAVAVQSTTWYDPCPQGTAALEAGVYALQQGAPETAVPALGIGEGDNLQPGGENGITLTAKVCVGTQVGQTSVQTGYGENASSALVNIYDRIAVLDPGTSPRVIDVYLNNALYRRVRW